MSVVFRVQKTKNYTVMCNHHLRNKNISLKAKGLLSQMLSLPDDWNYSLEGLASINKEKVDAIRTGIKELEAEGYIERNLVRDEKGRITSTEYIIHELPSEKPLLENPTLENPTLDKPTTENPTSENPTQLNTNKLNTDEINTDLIKYLSINQKPADVTDGQNTEKIDWIDRYNKISEAVKKQIDYDTLSHTHNVELLNDIVTVMTEVFVIDTPHYEIEGKKVATELVRLYFCRINYARLEAFLLDFTEVRSKIGHKKKYLLTALFNIASTAETSMTNRLYSNIYGEK